MVVTAESPYPLSRYGWEPAELDRFIAVEREDLLKPLVEARAERTGRRVSDDLLSKIAAQGGVHGFALSDVANYANRVIPEERTEAEYEAAVQEHLDAVRDAWPEAMREAAIHFVRPATFVLTNRSTCNYQAVLVEVHVGGEAHAGEFYPDTDELDLWTLLPTAPRKWGPRQLPQLDLGNQVWQAQSYIPAQVSMPPAVAIEHGGSFTLRFPQVNLRPQQRLVLFGGEDVNVLAEIASTVAHDTR